MKTHGELLDELYARVGSEKYETVRHQAAALAAERTGALAKIRERAHRDYCRAENTFNEQWQAAWVTACDEVLEGME